MPKALSVLIIDDDIDFCEILVFVLKDAGFEPRFVNSLKASMSAISAQNPSVIILDNNLPDGLGLNFLKEHRQMFNPSKVIFLTADPAESTKQQAFELGVYKFMTKPCSLADLQTHIHAA